MVTLCDSVPDFSNRCEPNASTKQWVPPPEDWVKANVDAAVFSESERMGAGCVIRDQWKFLGCNKPSDLQSL